MPSGGDAGQDQQAAADHGQGQVLTKQDHRTGDADGRLEVEQQADAGNPAGKDRLVPQQHPGHGATQGKEPELTPHRWRQLGQPRRGQRPGEDQVRQRAGHRGGGGGRHRPVGLAEGA